MPLLTKKSNLKSLKYGQDQPGGGNSGQPYQQVDINKVDSGFNKFRMTKFDDGLVRGGVIGAANASIVDTFRIGKFLIDFPKGPLWLVKQVGLQLANPKLEAKQLPVGRATSGLGFLRNAANAVSNVVNRVTNVIGPTRIYNPLGINTLAQVPLNAFGQHLVRFGAIPKQNNDVLYFKTAQFNNQGDGSANRLVKLMSIIGNSRNIDSYLGGSSSVYGIGTTLIRRRGDFIITNQDITGNDWAKTGAKDAGIGYRIEGHGGDLEGYNNASNRIKSFLGVSSRIYSQYTDESFTGLRNKTPDNLALSIASKKDIPDLNDKAKQQILDANKKITNTDLANLGVSKQYPGIETPTNLDKATYSTTANADSLIIANGDTVTSLGLEPQFKIPTENASYKTYQKLIDSKKLREKTYTFQGNEVNAFGIYGDPPTYGVGRGNPSLGILPTSNEKPTYTNKTKIVTLEKSWSEITRENRVGSGLQDQINLTPLFSATPGSLGDSVTIPGVGSRNINDLVKFRIQALDGNNPTSTASWMIFRAYITQFSDGVDATWNEVQYAGRGDKFYIYNGFNRKIQIGFKVAALSFEEMEPMYQKLNFLMGNVMPDYNDQGLMRGPMVKMTVGNWIDGQDGILNSVSYTVPPEVPWEIGLKVNGGIEPLILPHVLEVQMQFTPIGSQTKGVNKISKKSIKTSHIAQNVNDYQYIK